MQARTLKIIAALLILSAIVMGVIGYKISQQDQQRHSEPLPVAQTSNTSVSYAQKVVVVNQSIAKGGVITSDMLELVPFPVPVDDGYKTIGEVANKQLEFAVRKGEVIRHSHFEKQSKLAADIRPGYRAIAVDVNEVVGAGGFLVPGDHVDVIYTTRASKETYNKSLSRRILSNIKLLAYGSDIGEDLPEPATEGKNARAADNKDTGKRSRSAVLEVTEQEVNILTLAESSGKLRLVAVGESDLASGDGQPDNTATVQQDDDATFIRSVTGLKPPTPPKSVYVYSGDNVETIRVPK